MTTCVRLSPNWRTLRYEAGTCSPEFPPAAPLQARADATSGRILRRRNRRRDHDDSAGVEDVVEEDGAALDAPPLFPTAAAEGYRVSRKDEGFFRMTPAATRHWRHYLRLYYSRLRVHIERPTRNLCALFRKERRSVKTVMAIAS